MIQLPRRRLAIIALASVGLFLVLLVTPSPSAWATSADQRPQQVRVDGTASRSALGSIFASGEAVSIDGVKPEPQTILSWDSIVHNGWADKLALFTTSTHSVTVTLQGPGGVARDTTRSIGSFDVFSSGSKTWTVIFQDVPPGSYHLSATVRDGSGAVRATTAYDFTLAST